MFTLGGAGGVVEVVWVTLLAGGCDCVSEASTRVRNTTAAVHTQVTVTRTATSGATSDVFMRRILAERRRSLWRVLQELQQMLA